MFRNIIFATLFASLAIASPLDEEPRELKISTQYGGVCYATGGTPTTTTVGGIIVSTPAVSTTTMVTYEDYGTATAIDRYCNSLTKREETTIRVTNICTSTSFHQPTHTVTDPTQTQYVPSFTSTATAYTTWKWYDILSTTICG